MAVAFDAAVWRARADRQRKYSIEKRGKHPGAADQRWAEDLRYITCLIELIGWCRSKHLNVSFAARSGGGGMIFDDKEVELDIRPSPRHQFYVLLHECGHHLISKSNNEGRFSKGHDATTKKVKKTFDHRLDIIDEELEAWHRGWRLGSRLKLLTPHHDEEMYYRTRSLNMKTYLKWALKDPAYQLESDEE